MNARQMKKHLKKHIKQLQSDNDLMRRIIADSPTMQEMYDKFTKPFPHTISTMQFQEYRSKRFLPPDRPNDAGIMALLKREVTNDLLDEIRDHHITYGIDVEGITPTITASVFIGVR